MRCIIVLLNILIYSLCLARNYNLRLSPICIVKGDRVEKPCAHFKERPLEKLFEESWTEQAINKTEQGDHYANISISFGRKYDMNPILVMIRYEDSPLPEKTWEIQPVSRELIGFPTLITVAFAPTSTNLTRYQMRRIVNPSRPLDVVNSLDSYKWNPNQGQNSFKLVQTSSGYSGGRGNFPSQNNH